MIGSDAASTLRSRQPWQNVDPAGHGPGQHHWATSGCGAIRASQRRERNPASVTLTSRRTAAVEGRLPAAPRAWRQ
jgi:hypothetical protein